MTWASIVRSKNMDFALDLDPARHQGIIDRHIFFDMVKLYDKLRNNALTFDLKNQVLGVPFLVFPSHLYFAD